VQDIHAELGVENIKVYVSDDHADPFVSCPPRYLMRRIKVKTSRKLLREYSHLSNQCWAVAFGRGLLCSQNRVHPGAGSAERRRRLPS
jgi:hypothetical protein